MSRKLAENRIGKTMRMNNGLLATCVTYRGAQDMDVYFEDGAVSEHIQWGQFAKGHVAHPNKSLTELRNAKAKNRRGKLSAERVGTALTMKNGLYATCIAYRSSSDIDIVMEDGIIIHHRKWKDFTNGSITSPWQRYNPAADSITASRRTGTKRFMRNGMEATCTAYISSTDIEVTFSDGTVREHQLWGAFLNGEIRHPGSRIKKYLQSDRLGRTLTMNCGMKATCTSYTNHKNIEITFEDGSIRKNIWWANFIRGAVAPVRRDVENDRKSRLGLIKKMKNGHTAEIIEYNSNQDITVRLDDGTVREHLDWQTFKNGSIGLPKEDLFGKKNVMKNGLTGIIIACRKHDDIDVALEDGRIAEHVRYARFEAGDILSANAPSDRKRFLGFTKPMKTGDMAEITDYYSENNISVKFPNGTILHNRTLTEFLNGDLAPGSSRSAYNPDMRTGVTLEMENGLKATCTEYNSRDDIEVTFEDGTEVRTEWPTFKTRRVGRPQDDEIRVLKMRRKCIGTRIEQQCGMGATCIAYRKANDIDVAFDDGTIVKHRRWDTLNQGCIGNPSLKTTQEPDN